MRTFLIIIAMALISSSVYDFSIETIVVDKCRIEVLVMETPEEHTKGLLGYIERTFKYGGMLFKMDIRGRKIFHTIGMQMPIRIMGVSQGGDGSYRVVTDIFYAPPGIEAITINAPDVLEIPENKYQLFYKNCLFAREAK